MLTIYNIDITTKKNQQQQATTHLIRATHNQVLFTQNNPIHYQEHSP